MRKWQIVSNTVLSPCCPLTQEFLIWTFASIWQCQVSFFCCSGGMWWYLPVVLICISWSLMTVRFSWCSLATFFSHLILVWVLFLLEQNFRILKLVVNLYGQQEVWRNMLVPRVGEILVLVLFVPCLQLFFFQDLSAVILSSLISGYS